MSKRRKYTEIQEDIETAIELAIEEAHANKEEWDGEWDGSISIDVQGLLDDLEIEREDKLDGVIRGVKKMRQDIASLKAEKKLIDARVKTKENKMESYKEYLGRVLGGNKFESNGGVVSYRKSTPLVYSEAVQADIDAGKVPKGFEDFANVTTVVKVPKADVTKWLKADVKHKVEGAVLVPKVGVIVK